MATGRVIQFNETRGFGFIAPDGGGDDVFVHAAQLRTVDGSVDVGTRVRFEVVDSQRGQRAYGVETFVPPTQTVGAVMTQAVPVVEGPDEIEDELSDVVSRDEYLREITDALIAHCPAATGAQITSIGQQLTTTARRRGWIDG